MSPEYKHLTPDEQQHFVEHGWLRVPGAIKQEYIDAWMSDLFVRLGWDEHDKSTWTDEYLKMPRHREVCVEDFCPAAWEKICDIVGGEDKIDPVRDRYYGDQFHVNFGSAELIGTEWEPKRCRKFHTDNDFFRQFLDSGECALTIICAFTDMDILGGATAACEDGIKFVCQGLYDHPEGDDWPFEIDLYSQVYNEDKFQFMEAKAGDIIITHNFLPHAASPNRRHYARVITNPHVALKEPLKLHRENGDYTLVEKVILHHMNRPDGIPEYHPTRPRIAYYPRNGFFKRARVGDELERMVAEARRKGLPDASVGSIYQRPPSEIEEHERRNGYDKPWGPKGVAQVQDDDSARLKGVAEGKQILSYKAITA